MDPIDPQFQKTVRELQLKFTRFYARFLSKQNLTFSQFALTSLVYHGGEAPMSALARKLMISLPAVTHLVDRLEREKMIKRVPHGKDRRVTLIRITKKGGAAVQETQGRIQKLFMKTMLDFHKKFLNKIIASILVIFPLGLLLGCFFPTGIKLVRTSVADATPWYWALNGIFGVLCSALAVLFAIYSGISTNFVLGALCYLALFPVLSRLRH